MILVSKAMVIKSPDVTINAAETTANVTTTTQTTTKSKNKDPIVSTDAEPVPTTLTSSAEAI